MDLARGNIKADDYEAVTGEKAPVDLVDKGIRAAKGLAREMVKRAVSPTMVDPEGAAENAKGYDLGDMAMDAGLVVVGPVGWAAKGLGLDKKVKLIEACVSDNNDKQNLHLSAGLPPVFFENADEDLKRYLSKRLDTV